MPVARRCRCPRIPKAAGMGCTAPASFTRADTLSLHSRAAPPGRVALQATSTLAAGKLAGHVAANSLSTTHCGHGFWDAQNELTANPHAQSGLHLTRATHIYSRREDSRFGTGAARRSRIEKQTPNPLRAYMFLRATADNRCRWPRNAKKRGDGEADLQRRRVCKKNPASFAKMAFDVSPSTTATYIVDLPSLQLCDGRRGGCRLEREVSPFPVISAPRTAATRSPWQALEGSTTPVAAGPWRSVLRATSCLGSWI
jgi:hypothetical protein